MFKMMPRERVLLAGDPQALDRIWFNVNWRTLSPATGGGKDSFVTMSAPVIDTSREQIRELAMKQWRQMAASAELVPMVSLIGSSIWGYEK